MEKTKPKKLHLTVKILIGLIAGIIVGVILNLTNQAEIANTYISPFGTLFLNLIKMVIVPLVFASLVMGACGLGDIKKVGRIGGKTMNSESNTNGSWAKATVPNMNGADKPLKIIASLPAEKTKAFSVLGSYPELLFNAIRTDLAVPFVVGVLTDNIDYCFKDSQNTVKYFLSHAQRPAFELCNSKNIFLVFIIFKNRAA